MFDEREFHEIANGLPQLVAQRPEMEEIVSVVARVQMAIYCCQRVCGYAQQEVADVFR